MRILLIYFFCISVAFAVVSAGIWSEWTDYGPCRSNRVRNRKAGINDLQVGTQTRTRMCKGADDDGSVKEEDLDDVEGGEEVGGVFVEDEDDSQEECDKEGAEQIEKRNCRIATTWSRAVRVQDCSTTCGEGVELWTRVCKLRKGVAMEPGTNETCVLKQSETTRRKCMKTECAVDGQWTSWSEWGPCESAHCTFPKETDIIAQQYSTRTCTNPSPNFGGKMCQGPFLKNGTCLKPVNCPTDGGWSLWTEFGEWNCEAGRRTRTRSCDKPPPRNGGRTCEGDPESYYTKKESLEEFKKACNVSEEDVSASSEEPEEPEEKVKDQTEEKAEDYDYDNE